MLKTLAHEELGLSERTFPIPGSPHECDDQHGARAINPCLAILFPERDSWVVVSFYRQHNRGIFIVGASKVIVTAGPGGERRRMTMVDWAKRSLRTLSACTGAGAGLNRTEACHRP